MQYSRKLLEYAEWHLAYTELFAKWHLAYLLFEYAEWHLAYICTEYTQNYRNFLNIDRIKKLFLDKINLFA